MVLLIAVGQKGDHTKSSNRRCDLDLVSVDQLLTDITLDVGAEERIVLESQIREKGRRCRPGPGRESQRSQKTFILLADWKGKVNNVLVPEASAIDP